MILKLAIYLIAGLLLDCLITFHFRCVAEGRRFLASLSTFVYICLSFSGLGKIVADKEITWPIVAYAVGSTVGTWLAMRKP